MLSQRSLDVLQYSRGGPVYDNGVKQHIVRVNNILPGMRKLVARVNQNTRRDVREEGWIKWVHGDKNIGEVRSTMSTMSVMYLRSNQRSALTDFSSLCLHEPQR